MALEAHGVQYFERKQLVGQYVYTTDHILAVCNPQVGDGRNTQTENKRDVSIECERYACKMLTIQNGRGFCSASGKKLELELIP